MSQTCMIDKLNDVLRSKSDAAYVHGICNTMNTNKISVRTSHRRLSTHDMAQITVF